MTGDWKIKLRRSLTGVVAPRVLSSTDLVTLAAEAGLDLAPPSAAVALSRLASEMEEQGALVRVRRGLYLNQMCEPKATLPEAAQRFKPGAIVSLETVLGDAGVLNNFTFTVTAVLPFRPLEKPKLGRYEYGTNIFLFRGIPAALLEACAPEDVIDSFRYPHYPRATPEAAFAHWAYLYKSRNSDLAYLPKDIDPEQLDSERLARVAEAMGVTETIQEWLESAAAYEHELQTSGNTF